MGSEDWLEKEYRDHAPALFRFLVRLTRSEPETKDILQEVFIRLAENPGLLKNVAAPRPYLFRLAHRLAIDRHRHETTRRRHEERAGNEQASSIPPSTAEADAVWQRQALSAALESLPSEQKAVVLLKVWEEMTFTEIADVLQIPADTAASRYRYALDKLHRRLRPLERELK